MEPQQHQNCQKCRKPLKQKNTSHNSEGIFNIDDFYENDYEQELCQCQDIEPLIQQKKEKKQKRQKKQKKQKDPLLRRNDLDGQHVFKLKNFGLKEFCRKNQLEKLIKINKDSNKAYFVLLLCQIEKEIGQSNRELYQSLPNQYQKIIKQKIEQHKKKLIEATDQDDQQHERNALGVYKNAMEILKAYIVQQNPKLAMTLSYRGVKYDGRLQKAYTKLEETRKRLGLSEIQLESKDKKKKL